ncbi:MAG: CPBP family intramembrane glutamic endopeptidase [Longimicrobiales bacterium]
MGILRTDQGRIRTGWRVFLFFLLLPVFVVCFSLIPFQGLNWETVPILLGSLLAGWVLLFLDGRRPGALGFYLAPRVPLEGILGLSLGVAVAAGVVLGMAILGGIAWTPEGGGVGDFLKEGALALWFFTLPAAAEEALFRGYFLQALAESWGALWALLGTSLIFGVVHLSNPNTSLLGIVNIVMAGVFLGAVYLKTASLWWATGAHLGWNWALGFLADLPVSGLEVADSPLYEGASRGAGWISGGAFGPEGSLVATLGFFLGAFWVWRSPRIRAGRKALDVHPLILSSPGWMPRLQGVEGGSELENSGSQA